jgi:hypothetical protein
MSVVINAANCVVGRNVAEKPTEILQFNGAIVEKLEKVDRQLHIIPTRLLKIVSRASSLAFLVLNRDIA